MPFTNRILYLPLTVLAILIFLSLPQPTFSATFGYTTGGISSVDLASSSGDTQVRYGTTFTPSEAGTLDKITIYLAQISGSATETVDTTTFLNIEDSGGAGSHGLIKALERLDLSIPTAATWHDFTASGEAFSAVPLILNALADAADIADTNARITFRRDTVGSQNLYSESGTYGTLKAEDPWTEVATTGSTNRFSIYATYTASGGAATPPSAPNPPPIFFDGDSQLYPAKPERFTYQLKNYGRRSY